MRKRKSLRAVANEQTRHEVSAGGMVVKDKSILMVKVENLSGRIVWTFPKGHLEKGESAMRAALREVEEETGWRCRIVKAFGHVRYQFHKDGVTVNKTVHWFLMEPLVKEGQADPDEILDSRWFTRVEAMDLLCYPSDFDLMKRLKAEVIPHDRF